MIEWIFLAFLVLALVTGIAGVLWIGWLFFTSHRPPSAARAPQKRATGAENAGGQSQRERK